MIICADCPIPATCTNNQSLCAPLLNDEEMFGYLIAAGEKQMIVDEKEKDLFTQIARDIAYALSVVKIQEYRQAEEVRSEKLQDQLMQSQKMESVGRLAGGVAHDFNNMLGVIIGYGELASEKIDPKAPLYDDINEILIAAKRSAEITRQLLGFARQQAISPRILDFNETVESTLKMLRRLIGENIDLLWEPAPNLQSVKIDPSQLNQILTNLSINARDAISDVGRISIKTDFFCCDREYCEDHPDVTPGEYVLLSVSDDGTGMDKVTVENIFEPFFTTKEVGKGTGLGLAMIYGIVKQNKGFINVQSEPGRGTTFQIYFPCHTEPFKVRDNEKKCSNPGETPLSSGETVLVVEDEGSILKLVPKILKGLKYNVLSASTPETALSIAESHAGQIHLLLTDVIMPKMNGYELSKKLLAIHKDLKVLFMSGYTDDVIDNKSVLDRNINFIQKPFTNQELAMKVRKALNIKNST
jgi:two-component system sensor histidine kinase EvgS